MHIACLNPQGNFDPQDSYWTEHPDFGGQLVYVKELALAWAHAGHRVDVLTRRIEDPDWPEFAAPLDGYEGVQGVRIVRLPCGPDGFLPKEALWPHLGTDWLANILAFYERDGGLPDFFTGHYADGGLVGALLRARTGVPFTFTGHSLGAQKLDKLGAERDNLAQLDRRYRFARRIEAERVAMSHAARVIASTRQEQREQFAHRAYAGAIAPDSPRFAVVPPGVNRRVFAPDKGELDGAIRERVERALARDLDRGRRGLPLVICASRLDPKKNHAGLVRAFAESAGLRAAANLAIVVRGVEDPLRARASMKEGERAVMDELVDLIGTADLWGAVTAFPLESQAELAAAYRFAAGRRGAFALTALYEPFGLAPLEAMSCGLPAAVTRNGGPSESLVDDAVKRYGALVDPASPPDVARGLLEVLGDAWDGFRRAGIKRVERRYTWARTAQGYLEAVEPVLAEGEAEREREPIPAYFTDPRPETDIALATLAARYFSEGT